MGGSREVGCGEDVVVGGGSGGWFFCVVGVIGRAGVYLGGCQGVGRG